MPKDSNSAGDAGAAPPAPISHAIPIFIDGKKFEVSPGAHTVAELKQIGGVPADYVLAILGHGRLEDLPDDGTVQVKPGDHFKKHPRDGASS